MKTEDVVMNMFAGSTGNPVVMASVLIACLVEQHKQPSLDFPVIMALVQDDTRADEMYFHLYDQAPGIGRYEERIAILKRGFSLTQEQAEQLYSSISR